MYKEKINKIFNNHLPLFILFLALWVIYFSFIINYWYLLGIIIPFLFFKRIKPNKWQVIVTITILLFFILLIAFVPYFSLVEIFNNWFFKITNGGPKKWIDNFLCKVYDDETSAFIKLVLLNVKCKETYVFLRQSIDLGIVWLISSAAFHLSLISRIIEKISSKKKIIGYLVNVVFLSVYSFFLGFAYGCLRVLFKKYFKVFFIRKKISRINQLGFVGLLICLLNPSCFNSYSFSLSFLICIGSYFILELDLHNKLLTTLLINFVSFILTIPFVIDMNHKISLLSFINSFAFTYYFSFIFLYFLLFSWMPFASIVHSLVIKCCYVLIGNISFTHIYIYSFPWPEWAKITYYLVAFSLYKITYLIVLNNKI